MSTSAQAALTFSGPAQHVAWGVYSSVLVAVPFIVSLTATARWVHNRQDEVGGLFSWLFGSTEGPFASLWWHEFWQTRTFVSAQVVAAFLIAPISLILANRVSHGLSLSVPGMTINIVNYPLVPWNASMFSNL